MEFLKQPASMSMSGDLGSNWRKFKNSFTLYLVATGCKEKPKEVQAAVLLHCLGEEVNEVLETLDLTADEKTDPDTIVKKLDVYFLPKCNSSVETHKFNSRNQLYGESFEHFLAELKKIARDCEFGTFRDRLIKDRIVSGIRDRKVKERLLRETNLDLTKTIEICRVAEQTEQHIKEMIDKTENLEVSEIKHGKNRMTYVNENSMYARRQEGNQYRRQLNMNSSSHENRREQNVFTKRGRTSDGGTHSENSHQSKCGRCGLMHRNRKCPAFGKQCRRCFKFNHFAHFCTNNFQSGVNVIADDEHYNDNDYVLGSIQIFMLKNSEQDWFETLYIPDCGKYLKFKLDTGAHVNVIPENMWRILKIGSLKKIKLNITNYGGQTLDVVGSYNLRVVFNGKNYFLDFIILKTNGNSPPVLGIRSLQELNLVQRNIFQIQNNNIFTENPALFEGIGKILSSPVNFQLKRDYQPKVVPCRRVPFHLMDKLKAELDRMISDNIITTVKKPTEFVNPIVIVKKPDNSIRICLDPQNLNDALLREHYEIPTFDEITRDMCGAKIFSTLDASKGFWQIVLTEEASELTTFATPFGRYMFLRLPYGVCNAPEIFHRTFTEIFGDIKGVKVYIDDIIIYAKTLKEHDEILEKVFFRATRMGVKFNKNKCRFRVKEVKYVGHILTDEGIKIDNDKIEAIKRIDIPKNTKELSRFLGMVTNVAKFIPNLSKLTSNLRALLKKDVVWEWNDIHQKKF